MDTLGQALVPYPGALTKPWRPRLRAVEGLGPPALGGFLPPLRLKKAQAGSFMPTSTCLAQHRLLHMIIEKASSWETFQPEICVGTPCSTGRNSLRA